MGQCTASQRNRNLPLPYSHKKRDITFQRNSIGRDIEDYRKNTINSWQRAITPKIRDSVKALREFQDAETEEEFLAGMKRRGANIVP